MSSLHQLQIILTGREIVVVLWYDSEHAARIAASDIMSGSVSEITDDYGQTFLTRPGECGSALVKHIEKECLAVVRADTILKRT